jgi:hypothetical protein
MELKHISTIKQPDGVVEVEVVVVNESNRVKRYTYYLSSEWGAREFHRFYRQGRKLHGKALAVLNAFKIKDPKDITGTGGPQWHRNKG